MTQLAKALTRLFERHRIIFWYDDKRELRAEYDALALPGVEKIELGNNQFGVKHRILRQEPEQRFLLYHAGPPPADLDNWLLDVQLAHGEFRADQVSLWLTELGLGLEFSDVAAPHAEFFQSARRREALKAVLEAGDTAQRIRLKMLAVCTGAEPRLDSILEALLAELAVDKADKAALVNRCALSDYLWEQCRRVFGYESETPGLRDFVITLFDSCYAAGLGEGARLRNDAVVFLNRWKDSVRHHEAFESLSAQCADVLDVEQDLVQRDFRLLAGLDLFELIDRKILSDLAPAVAGRTLSEAECDKLIRLRREGHWYDGYADPYEAIGAASHFLGLLGMVDLTVRSLADGVQQYSGVWYRLDQLYRQFIFHAQRSGQTTLLAPLLELVENHYANNYLLTLNDRWQQHVDAASRWEAANTRLPVLAQQDFYTQRVRPFLARGNKVFVVISDALRYEAGEELLRLIRQEDRFEAEIESALTVLPSYTQLGMAALLPHESLEVAKDASGSVLVDGASSQGTTQRAAILDRALPGKATALRAEELMAMGRDESRALIRDHDVVYIYHNRIDAVGDKRDTEARVCEAVDETLDDLVKVIKKLANANANNLIVTADHGFIYQHRALDESDFASSEPQGREFWVRTRRFVLGSGLVATASFKKFTAAETGLAGDAEMLIPKSINRLRLSGAGSRYVHGGAALQEVVIPVIKINKKRESDLAVVDVDIIRSANTTITTGQVSITFYQTGPVTEKVQPRTLRVGIYTQGGVLISDRHELVFDLTSENPRERERTVQFVLTSQADEANNEEVILRLDERVAGTSHHQEYKSARYVLRRTFTSDFDV